MADNLTTATIDVRANTRGLEKDILKALKTVEFSEINTKKSSQALGRITGQVSEFNKSLEASNARVVAFGASAGAIFAVEKAFSSLISSTIEVQKKLTDVNILLNLSSSGLQKFGDSLFDIAKNTAQSFSTVADAATELSRQGLGVEETLKRTNAALVLTRLSGLDAKSSVDALTATLNSFAGSALDAVEVVNKLANVDAAFAVSSADLANAISRVGSTAVDAGVSLDELIALVTSAQQTTARGGAVIGNSFKTIFTRLQRGKVQDLLGSLGVDTTEGQSAISLLQQLAATYDTLGAAQKSYVAEQVGGVFQINILKAALSDLGKEYSIFGRALDTSLSSTDEAIRRNELLNQTISALSSQAVSGLQQAASKIGSIVFEPNAKGFLSGFNNLLDSFNNIDAESAGGKLMTGFFKGIGDFISGPGAVLATAVLVKLFSNLAKFAAGSAKELLGTNKAAQQQAAIEQSILSILQKNSQFTSQILSGKMTTVQAEKELLTYLTAQSNILREQERLSKIIGANLMTAGVSIGSSGIPIVAASKGKKAASSGFIPNFASDQAIGQAMENAGARQHGYKAGKAKKTTIHDGNGKSFKSFVNSKEDVKTFTNSAGKKATIVRPPNGFGENTQYAAGGFVPNFAKNKNEDSIRKGVLFEKRLNKALSGSASFSPNAPMDFPLPTGYGNDYEIRRKIGISDASIYGDAKLTRSRKSEQSLLDKYLRTPEGVKDFLSAKETSRGFINLNPNGLSMLFSGSGSDSRGISYISSINTQLSAGAKRLISSRFGKNHKKSRTLAMPYIADKINEKNLSGLSSGFIPNFGKMQDLYKNTKMREGKDDPFGKRAAKANLAAKKGIPIKDLGNLPYTMIHPGGGSNFQASASYTKKDKKTNSSTQYVGKIWTAGLDASKLNRKTVQDRVGDALVTEANNLTKIFNPSGSGQFSNYSQLSNTGSVFSAAGTVFESAVRKAFNVSAQGQGDRIDFPNPSSELRSFFGNAPGPYEAKISNDDTNRSSTLSKWIAVNGLSGGFIPSFANSKNRLSFSYKDKDEFGISEIEAIMSGKKVGSFSYAEDRPGIVDVGDLTVNKGERGKGIGSALYKEAIKRNAGKKMKGQLLPQMNRLLEKIKKGEPVSAETLYPQIKRADLAKSSVFEVYGHKGLEAEKMTRDQFTSFVNAKITELKKDPKRLQSYFGNVEADEYGGLGVDLQTQHSSGFIPNFASGIITGDVIRGNEYKSVLDFLAKTNKPVRTIIGPSGSGKTTMASKSGGSIVKSFNDLAGFDSYILDRATMSMPKDEIVSENLKKIFRKSGESGALDLLVGSRNTIKSLREKRAKEGDSLIPDRKQFTSGSGGISSFVKGAREFASEYPGASVSRIFKDKSEYKTKKILSGGFVPNFASPKLIEAINKRIKNPNVAQKLKEGAGLNDSAYMKAASKLGIDVAGLEAFLPQMGFPLRGKDKVLNLSKAIGFGFGRSFIIDALKMGDWNYVKPQFESAGYVKDDFDKLSKYAKTPKGESALKWWRSKSSGFIPNFASPKKSGKTFNSYMSKPLSDTIRFVHPLKPVIDSSGNISFPGLPKKGAKATIIHGEAMAGQERMTLDEFYALAEKRKNDPRFWGRNSFEYVYNSGGFVPNFADALNNAIAREKSSGLSNSQIYVDQHSSLKNKNNPMGLMVANTRDEPGGGIQGIKRAKKEGKNPKTYGTSFGYVPNFATGPIQPSQDYLNALNEAVKAVDKLSQSSKKASEGLNRASDSVEKFDNGASGSGKGKMGKIGGFLKDNALTVGFGLQSIASMAGEYAGNDDTKSGRAIKAGAGAVGDIASFTGTGAMIAGPWGAAAGFAVGLGKAALDLSKALTTKVPDMEKALQTSSDAMNRFGESGQKLLQLNEQYGDALNSGNPGQAADIMVKTQKAYAEELSKLTQAQRDSFISAVAQGKGQEEYAKILGEMQDSVRASESALSLQKFSESKGFFGGPDKKLISGIDKTLVSDLTKGLDADAIKKALENASPVLTDKSAGTENQAIALMKSLAQSESLTVDQKANFEKIIDSFASAAAQTDLGAVSEAFVEGIQLKPKSFEDVQKAQEAYKKSQEINNAKIKEEIAIREKANASLLQLQSETEAIYTSFNDSLERFISSVETAAKMRAASVEFKQEFYSEGGVPSAAESQKEKNIVQASRDNLTVDIYKSQVEASNNFNSAVKDLVGGLDIDIAKLGVGGQSMDQQNQLLGVQSSIQKALLPIQGMILKGDYEGARQKTSEALSGLKPEEVSAVGVDAITKVGQQLDQTLQDSARKLDQIKQNSQKDLAIQAQQLVFQRAMSKLSQAQGFGGTDIKGLITDNGGESFQQAISSLKDLKTLGYNQKDLQKGYVKGGGAETYGIKDKKANAAMSGKVIDFYGAASKIIGSPVLSTQSKDFGALAQAVSDQIRNQMDKFKAAGEGVVDPAVFSRMEKALATLGGGDMVAQLKIFKNIGVADVGGKQVMDEALKTYSGGQFANLSPELKKAFESTTDEGAAATLLLVAVQDKQTQSLNTGFNFLSGIGGQTNDLLSKQPDAIAAAIGAVLEKGRADSEAQKVNREAASLDKQFFDSKAKLKEANKGVDSAQAQVDSIVESLGGNASGSSIEDFIKSMQVSQKDKDKAKSITSLGRNEYINYKTSLEMTPTEILSGLPTPRSDKAKQESAKKYDEAVALQEKVKKLDALKAASQQVSSKKSEAVGISNEIKEINKKYDALAPDIQAKNDAAKKASEVAAQSRNLVLDKKPLQDSMDYYANDKKAREAALAQSLATENLKKTKQQKQTLDRTSGAEKAMSPTGKLDTYENIAITKAGGANQAAFQDLLSQMVVPSFDKFKDVYASLGEEGGAKGAYERTINEMIGPALSQKLPIVESGSQGQQIASAITEGIKQASASVVGGGITREENKSLMSKHGYVEGEGWKNESGKAAYSEELKMLKEQKQAQQQLSSQTSANNLQKNAEQEQAKKQESEKAKAQSAQQDPTQLISSILTTVQQISTDLQKKAAGTTEQQPSQSGSAGGISVSAPVSFSVNSTAGEGKDAASAIAEQIKVGLSSFLSSPEFIGKVTSIANQAAGNKTPPTSLPK
jgi:TP901 family phage tail tape measure protein